MNNIMYTPYRLNNQIELKNRIVMAPMTRNMAHNDLSPTEDMARYYAKRAQAGLIVTEGTIIRADSKGYSNVPGIFTDAHINGWRKVTQAVHENEGKIFLQIWHVGRVSHPFFLNGNLPISASATTMIGPVKRSKDLIHGKCRAVTLEEVNDLVGSFAKAAENAKHAGFDGIEIHGANGYLIDQFLHYHTNHRLDAFGGSPENMARFALMVVKACGEAIGFEQVGLRLSPGAYLNEIEGDCRDAEVFQYVLEQLNEVPLAYIHTGNFDDSFKFKELGDLGMTEFMRRHYHGTLIACGGYTFQFAYKKIMQEQFDLVAMGRPFIANPDLIDRLKFEKLIKEYDNNMLEKLY